MYNYHLQVYFVKKAGCDSKHSEILCDVSSGACPSSMLNCNLTEQERRTPQLGVLTLTEVILHHVQELQVHKLYQYALLK